MKNKLIYFLLLLPALFVASGCQKYELGNPAASTIADFTYTVTNSGNAPCEVTFANASLNANGYLWDFGNGKTSTEANPVVAYDTPGLYTVKLTCTPANDVHYNLLTKTMVVNIKDPNAGLTQVLYFTTRGPENGGVHMVVLNDDAPQIQDFDPVELSRPYGIAVDTINRKVYVSDYLLGYIYRFDADGKNAVKILDAAVPGQEIVDSPEALMVVGDKLYWGRTGGIYRCNLDGTNPEVFFDAGAGSPEYPIDMQYDPTTGKIYLVNDKTDYTGGYFSLNFDGSGLTEHLLDVDGTAIEVNTAAGKVYIAGYASAGTVMSENGIYMCNTDGTQLSKIGEYGSKATWGITIDHKRNKLFWAYKNSNSAPDGKIVRSNLDGSATEDWLTGVSPHAMQVAWIKL
jgi:PKD repeat protein